MEELPIHSFFKSNFDKIDYKKFPLILKNLSLVPASIGDGVVFISVPFDTQYQTTKFYPKPIYKPISTII